jgi:hypothetical protein
VTAPNSQIVINDNGHKGLPPGFAVDVENADAVKCWTINANNVD